MYAVYWFTYRYLKEKLVRISVLKLKYSCNKNTMVQIMSTTSCNVKVLRVLWLLKYFSQEVVEEVVLTSIMFTYLKVNAPTQVEWEVEYSHIHISTLLCTRARPKPLGWFEEEGKLVWDRASA